MASQLTDSLGDQFDVRVRAFGEGTNDVDLKQLDQRKPNKVSTLASDFGEGPPDETKRPSKLQAEPSPEALVEL